MIFEILLNVISVIVMDLFSYIGDIPAIPVDVQNMIDKYFNLATNAINCIGLFVDLKFVRLLLPVILAMETIDKAYTFFMWCTRKIPFVGVE